MHDASNLEPGTRIGPYALAEPLGRGSQATVYLARDEDGEEVAVKVRRRGLTTQDRRFLREFESMRTLRLPGVVRVFEAGIEGDLLWFSMEVVWGRPILDVALDEGDVAVRISRAVRLGTRLMDILDGVHRAGFVHRDLKPSNILVDRQGRVHVLDFGVVRYFSEGDTLSHSGELLGTVPYMAPEQLASLPMDHAVDLFATGLLLYEAVGGRRPRPNTTVAWIPRICLERLAPLATRYREVPLALSALVEQLTSPLPHARPSAAESAARLRSLEGGADSPEWPQPDFVEPGEWFQDLECDLPDSRHHGRAWVLEGPAGSGRRRAAEQLHRHAVLQGVWPIHSACRAEVPGAPLQTVIEAMVDSAEDEAELARVVGGDAGVLYRAWPHLALPADSAEPGGQPDLAELAQAVARCLDRGSERRPILVVVERLEQVDALTARGIVEIARATHGSHGLLLLHDRRWQTSLSHELVAGLASRYDAHVHALEPVSGPVAADIAASLCPAAPPGHVRGGLPLEAVHQGLVALAAWRGAPWLEPSPALWPLALRENAPVPEEVLVRLVGREVLEQPWVRTRARGLVLSGRWARAMVATHLDDLHSAARTAADTWMLCQGSEAPMEDIAALRLLGEDPTGAWLPAAHAALAAAEQGRHRDAGRWLLLLDTLPRDRVSAGHLAFDLAMARARVALDRQVGSRSTDLVEVAESRATTPEQRQLAQILASDALRRAGQVRPALVAALRVASPSLHPTPEVAARALIAATRCRLALGQLPEAIHQLERAADTLRSHPHPSLEVDVENLRARLLLEHHDLLEARKIARRSIDRAAAIPHLRGLAEAEGQLARVLRLLGRRREAERHARAAREAADSTGDRALDAETGLALATLLAERGDAAGARHLLDETIRRIRGLHLEHLVPAAMRVALQVATLMADPTDATMALATMDPRDPEAGAVRVRWWRTRGDYRRVDLVEEPPPRTHGRALWLCERSRAWLAAGETEAALGEAEAALGEAMRLGFAELQLYARLLVAALTEEDDRAWAQQVRKASSSLFTEVYLGALELDARRLHARGDPEGARRVWRMLRARSLELGYRPGVEEASGWLA